MKIKFNLWLTISLVSLFISVLLLILDNQNKYCQFFSLILLAVAIVSLCQYRVKAIDKLRREIDDTLNYELEVDDEEFLPLSKDYVDLKKKKIKINIFAYLFALLLLIAGIFCLF